MTELIKALTCLIQESAIYVGQLNGRVPRGGPVVGPAAAPIEAVPEKNAESEPVKEKRTRKPKEDKAEATAPAANAGGMTEEDSTKGTTDVAKLLVSKFNKVIEGKPEGFHIAKKILIEGFKVGRLSDLSHEQRVAFISQVKGILVNGAAAPAETAGVGL